MNKVILSILLFISSELHAQLQEGELAFGWQQQGTFLPYDAEGYAVIQTKDGGYAITGWIASSAMNDTPHVYIIKLDSSGNLQWQKTVGTKNTDVGNAIVQTTDGGYAIAGTTNASLDSIGDYINGKVYLIRLDSGGNILWTRSIGGTTNDGAGSMVQTTDGGFAITGSSNSFGTGVYNIYVVKLDSSGNVQWTRTIGGKVEDIGSSIVQTKDKGYAITGATTSFNNQIYQRVYIVKLDSAGNLQWAETSDGDEEESGFQITQVEDGGYVLIGWTYSYGAGNPELYVLRLNSAGVLLWTRTIGGGMGVSGSSIIQTKDGGYAMTGYTNVYSNNSGDVYVLKMDSIGNLLWTRIISGANVQWGYSIVQTKDEGYAVTGFTDSYGVGGSNVYFLKLDSFGRSCSATDSGGIVGSGGSLLDVTDSTIVDSGGYIVYNDSTIGSIGTLTNICSTFTTVKDIPNPPENILLYPNPTDGIFNVSFSGKIYSVQVLDVEGRLVTENFNQQLNKNNFSVNLEGKAKGVYFLRAATTNGIINGKLVIE